MNTPRDILVICDAYESAMGSALCGDVRSNPYPIDSNGWHAYNYGNKIGFQRYKEDEKDEK